MTNARANFDIVVVGAGIAGLWIARNLCLAGLRVLVIELAPLLGSGATTRNEGWLHCGSVHAVLIEDVDEMLRVVAQVRGGYEQIRALYPEVLETSSSYAFSTSAAVARERWRMARVPFSRLTRREFACLEPDVQLPSGAEVFRVEDAAIKTDLLVAALVQVIRVNGGQIRPNTRVVRVDSGVVTLVDDVNRFTDVRAKVVVHSAGPGLREALVRTGMPVGLRFFGSHLLDFGAVTRGNVFSVDPGGLNVFKHGAFATATINSETGRYPLPNPEFTPCPHGARELTEAVSRLIPKADVDTSRVRTCIKVDLSSGLPAVHAGWRSSGSEVFVVPGKMTSAPVVACEVTHYVFEMCGGAPGVARRPFEAASRVRALSPCACREFAAVEAPNGRCGSRTA